MCVRYVSLEWTSILTYESEIHMRDQKHWWRENYKNTAKLQHTHKNVSKGLYKNIRKRYMYNGYAVAPQFDYPRFPYRCTCQRSTCKILPNYLFTNKSIKAKLTETHFASKVKAKWKNVLWSPPQQTPTEIGKRRQRKCQKFCTSLDWSLDWRAWFYQYKKLDPKNIHCHPCWILQFIDIRIK